MKPSRRDLLRYSACGLLGQGAFLSGFDRFSMASAIAGPAAISPTDYKALVCIFMFGGNDSNNMVVSLDNYTNYSTNRGVLAIPQAQLLPIAPKSGGNYGLHPNLAPSAITNGKSVQSLFQSGALAVVCNTGTLTAPINKMQYQAGTHPYQLFSHSDQQNQWQTSSSSADGISGWGGRMSDQTQVASSGFPTVCSVAGVSVFSVGAVTLPIALAPAPTPLNQTLTLVHPDNNIANILMVDRESTSPTLVQASDNITQYALNNSALLSQNPTIKTVFPATGLGNQLLQVAKLISLNSALGIKRQIFFCSIGGFDTHTVQLATQMSLMQQLSDAMTAILRGDYRVGSFEQGHHVYAFRFQPYFQAGGNGGHYGGFRSRVGQPSLHHGRLSQGRRFLWNFPRPVGRTDPRRRLRSRRAWTLDSDDCGRRVRVNSRTLVRTVGRRSSACLPEYWGVPNARPGLHDVEPLRRRHCAEKARLTRPENRSLDSG